MSKYSCEVFASYLDGFFILHEDERMAFVGPDILNQGWAWSYEKGLVKSVSRPTGHGFAPTAMSAFACDVPDGPRGNLFNVGRLLQFVGEKLTKERAEWPDDAMEMCGLLERKIYEIFNALKESTKADERNQVELRNLRSALAEAKRAAAHAGDAAEELKRRARESDPVRIRREIKADMSARHSAMEDEIRRLRAELHEAQSQVAKLAEDKKRLRAALNTRGGK